MNKHDMREAAIERLRHAVKHQTRGPLCADDVTEALVGDGWVKSSVEEDVEIIIELLTDDEPFLLHDDVATYLGDEFAKGPRDADGILWFSGDMSDSEWGVIEGVFYDCTQREWLVRGHDLTAPWIPADSIRHAPMRTATQREDDLIELIKDAAVDYCLVAASEGRWHQLCNEFEEGYVTLPKDANDEVIHIGDKVTVDGHDDDVLVVIGITYEQERRFPFECKWETAVRSANCLDRNDYISWPRFYFDPEKLHHYYEPTVEDILSEFAEDVLDAGDDIDVNEAIEEYAKRLQVRKEDADGRCRHR